MSEREEGEPGLRCRIELELQPSGDLSGWLRATNLSDHVVRLSGKPTVTPLGVDGSVLPVDCVVTAEMRIPGYVDLGPGDEAKAPMGWGGWTGPPASGGWEVRLDASGPRRRVEASGPRQPTSHGPATNTWSSWWQVTEPGDGGR